MWNLPAKYIFALATLLVAAGMLVALNFKNALHYVGIGINTMGILLLINRNGHRKKNKKGRQ